MASITRCVRDPIPTGLKSGVAPATYTQEWKVQLDDKVPFTEALRLGHLVARSGENYPIPRLGTYFRYVSPNGLIVRDTSAIALDFDPLQLLDDGYTHELRVTWRPPAPGAWEEPIRVRQADPGKRVPYRWIEYYTESQEVTKARNEINIGKKPASGGDQDTFRKVNTEGPITTAAGEEVTSVFSEELHSVFVTERIVSSPRIAHELNQRYFNAINKDRFIHPLLISPGTRRRTGQALSQRTARFLRAEVGQYPFWEAGQEWFTMQLRIEIQNEPFRLEIPNRGTLRYDDSVDGEGKVIVVRDTDAVTNRVNLNKDGTKTDTTPPITIPYRIHREVNFASDTFPLTAYV